MSCKLWLWYLWIDIFQKCMLEKYAWDNTQNQAFSFLQEWIWWCYWSLSTHYKTIEQGWPDYFLQGAFLKINSDDGPHYLTYSSFLRCRAEIFLGHFLTFLNVFCENSKNTIIFFKLLRGPRDAVWPCL